MKKKLFLAFAALILLMMADKIMPALPVLAASDLSRLVDAADLLSFSEEASLLEQLDEISERQQVDLAVVTVDSLEGAPISEFADDFYDSYGYGYGEERDGILFLVSMEERDWYITTVGYGITAVTDAGREYMAEKFLDDLSSGAYAAAFSEFAELCDDFITQAKTGEPYDVDHLPKEPFAAGTCLAIALILGFLIALIVTGIMRSKLKTVHSQSQADNYVKKDSMQLTKKNDLFLYRHVERREKPKDDSAEKEGGSKTHTSSSGTTHGGGGGKF